MTRTRRIRGCLLVAGLAASVAMAAPALADVPKTLMHQGRLYDAMGEPLTATLDVTFAMYAGPVDTSSIWQETHTVTFEDGYFSVALGTDEPVDAVLDGSERYLGIKVGGDAE